MLVCIVVFVVIGHCFFSGLFGLIWCLYYLNVSCFAGFGLWVYLLVVCGCCGLLVKLSVYCLGLIATRFASLVWWVVSVVYYVALCLR